MGDSSDDMSKLAEHEPVASLLTSAGNRLRAWGWIQCRRMSRRIIDGSKLVAHRECEEVPEGEQPGAARTDATSDADTLNYAAPVHFSERLDRILIHKVWGLLIFAADHGRIVRLDLLARPAGDERNSPR